MNSRHKHKCILDKKNKCILYTQDELMYSRHKKNNCILETRRINLYSIHTRINVF